MGGSESEPEPQQPEKKEEIIICDGFTPMNEYDRFTPISECKNIMNTDEFLHSYGIDPGIRKKAEILMDRQNEFKYMLDNIKNVSENKFINMAKIIKPYKDEIKEKTSITIYPDVDNTPNNNVYKLNKKNVLFNSNNHMDRSSRYNDLVKRLKEINKKESFTSKFKFNKEKDSILKEMYNIEHFQSKPSFTRTINEHYTKPNQTPLYQTSQRPRYENDINPSTPTEHQRQMSKTEGFVSSGTEGANYNKSTDTITGPALFTNQILQNGTTWNDLKDVVKNKGMVTDGTNILGAGPGNDFDKSMSAHIRNMEIMKAANNEYNTPNMLKEINKNINQDISGGPTTSLYNRGNQTKGKIISLPDKAVGVLPEEFYPERAKNRNIYKTQEIIPIAGFNINEARIGENLSEIHPVLYLQRSHRRMATGAGTTGNLSEHVGKIEVPAFDARIGRTGEDKMSGSRAMETNKTEQFSLMDNGAKTGVNNFKGSFKAAEGGNYWMPKRFVY